MGVLVTKDTGPGRIIFSFSGFLIIKVKYQNEDCDHQQYD